MPRTTTGRGSGAPTARLALVFGATGASALVMQVVWQRVVSMHSGVDLTSSTTVVAGFLAGLGLGSLAGGRLADRVGPRASLGWFAVTNVCVAVVAWFSTALFYDLYRQVAPSLGSRWASVAFNLGLLLVPTFLQGLSLPLVARAATRRIADAGALVGRLYGVNTFGGALGAFAAGWFLIGRFGLVAAVRVAAVTNLLAAAAIAALWWASRREVDDASPEVTAPEVTAPEVTAPERAPSEPQQPLWRWYLLYGALGAVALGFQQVFFRLVDAALRSNSYSFPIVLAVYLGCWGVGAAAGSAVVRRVTDPRRWFLGLQVLSGVAAAGCLLLLVGVVAPAAPGWFRSDGFIQGISSDDYAQFVRFGIGLPVLVMALPIVLIGASYPFVQAVVSDRLDGIGRRTAALAASNIAGNVAGTVLVGFVVLDALGTAGTYRLLVGCLAALALAVVVRSAPRSPERRVGGPAVLVLVLLVAVLPTNQRLWEVLLGDVGSIVVAEDHSCASVLQTVPTEQRLVINGTSQNFHPYDDFHVLIGLLPALMADRPADGLAVGFGIGSTTYGMLSDRRLDRLTTVELCGGNYDLARRLADRGEPDFVRLFDDPRSRLVEGDGRRHLLVTDEDYDVVVVDTLRPNSANSGAHFSVEFYELIRSRLAEGGVLAEWVPTGRSLNAAAAAFPHVVTGTVPSYNDTMFLLGSSSPIRYDRDEVLRRFDAIGADRFRPEQRASLRAFLEEWEPACATDGAVQTGVDPALVDTDLHPRDEYAFDNPEVPPDAATRSC